MWYKLFSFLSGIPNPYCSIKVSAMMEILYACNGHAFRYMWLAAIILDTKASCQLIPNEDVYAFNILHQQVLAVVTQY